MNMLNLVDLELRHLAALRAVAEEGTFGTCRRSLGFSQSAVSQQIAALERIVGDRCSNVPAAPDPCRSPRPARSCCPTPVSILDRVRVTEADIERVPRR